MAVGETPALSVRGLTKRYGRVTAVDDLSFDVAAGSVTGFLGPNGAGKTTTLRMLLGLARPTAGTATFGGSRYRELADPCGHVGAVLETPGFHPARRARDHLRVVAAASGRPLARVDEVLDHVGLGAAASERVKGLLARHAPNASVWPPRCLAPRVCSSSTSRRTASTQRAFAGCVKACAPLPTTAAPC